MQNLVTYAQVCITAIATIRTYIRQENWGCKETMAPSDFITSPLELDFSINQTC